MPFLRASAVIAVIFAFSPVREGAPARDHQGTGQAPAITDSRQTDSPAAPLAAAHDELERAHALWTAMPEESRAELARIVMDELRREISR